MSILKVSLAAIAAGFMVSSVHAADLIVADPVVDMASPSAWSPYAGIVGTVGNDGATFGGVGVVIGADVDLTDVVFVGGELRGMAYFAAVGYTGFELLASGRIGFHATDDLDLYATGGVGYFAANVPANSGTFYSVGVGAEFDVAQDMAIRAEVTGTGNWGGGINSGQATLGLLWKL